MIKLYTIDCPACLVLEEKLNAKNITFLRVNDEEEFEKKNIDVFPVLEMENGELMSYRNAVKWVKEYEN
jgi:hypothetical protein